MNIEECLKEDGKYILLECQEYAEEYELIVKDYDSQLFQIIGFPFSKEKVSDRDISLLCDLHESEDWKKESYYNNDKLEKNSNILSKSKWMSEGFQRGQKNGE